MSEATFDEVYGVLIDVLTGLVGEAYVEEMEVGRTAGSRPTSSSRAWRSPSSPSS